MGHRASSILFPVMCTAGQVVPPFPFPVGAKSGYVCCSCYSGDTISVSGAESQCGTVLLPVSGAPIGLDQLRMRRVGMHLLMCKLRGVGRGVRIS